MAMEIRFYNSLTNKIEKFTSIKENKVTIYVCGPTVYNHPHIGNMRPAVFFDTLRRFFIKCGYEVEYASNYTDVDDKIINKAIEEGVSEKVITERYIKAYEEVSKELNILPATFNPKATEYIGQIVDYIDNLVKTGNAYEVDGEVFFDVKKIEDYGVLSNVDIDNLYQNARIDLNSKKRDQLDFLLWKKTDVGIKWDSPFSKGRPGWHTECCVMIDSLYGDKIDIHGGGSDLKFPHHENEIAQAMATHQNHLANYWIHTGMMDINGDKMSKSLGNVILAKDIINEFGGDIVRLCLLNSQYRQTINFTDKFVLDNRSIYEKIVNCYKQLSLEIQKNNEDLQGFSSKTGEFLEILADDMNLTNGITYLLDAIKIANSLLRSKEKNLDELKDYFYLLNDIIYVLGLSIKPHVLTIEDIKLLKDYDTYKAAKDYENSDKIRKVLQEKGIL